MYFLPYSQALEPAGSATCFHFRWKFVVVQIIWTCIGWRLCLQHLMVPQNPAFRFSQDGTVTILQGNSSWVTFGSPLYFICNSNLKEQNRLQTTSCNVSCVCENFSSYVCYFVFNNHCTIENVWIFLKMYLFERERETTRGRGRGRGRTAQSDCTLSSISPPWDHNLR